VVSARLGWDLAINLNEGKALVTVICPQPSRPLNADYSNYKNSFEPIVTQEDGLTIVRQPSFSSPQSGLFSRLRESWSFGRHVCQCLEKSAQKPDVMYVNAWPLLAQAQIVRFAKKNQIPVILQVMDIYPESLVGKLPVWLRDIISWPLLQLDAWIAQQAHSVVVISDNMRRTYTKSRRIPADRVATIPTWQDESLFENIPPRADACRRYAIPENLFTFLYLGNIGPVAGVDFLIRAFHKAAVDEAQLVIVGDGSAKADCIKLAGRLNVPHVHFISDPDAANVPLLQSMAHVCLLPMKSGTGMSSIPSKLPAYLFSSKPVLATVDPDSDTASLIQKAECGWIGPPEDLDWLPCRMREISVMPEDELTVRGCSGQKFGLKNFSKSYGVKQLSQLVLSAISAEKSRAEWSVKN
jgi:glycosyltransferase involved in cell wall biosynthesis